MAFLVKKAMKTTINVHAFGVCRVKNRLEAVFCDYMREAQQTPSTRLIEEPLRALSEPKAPFPPGS
jgi:hypothetical protein